MDSEEHLVGCRTAGAVRCRTVRRRPVEEQFDQQLMLALRVPTMGGLPPPTAASASAARGSDAASATRGTDADNNPVHAGAAPEASGAAGSTDQPMASGPEDLPEEGEQGVDSKKVLSSDQSREREADL
eukprot:2024525-Amphidinium_carterae.1